MPDSAFIRHTVNNGTARSDDSEADRESRVVEKLFNNHITRKKDKFNGDFFSFLVQRRVLSFTMELRTEIGSKMMAIWDDNPLRGMNEERTRERERNKILTEHRIIDEIKILRHVTIHEYVLRFFSESSSSSSYFSLFTFIPHRTKFPASSKQRSDMCQMQISRRAIGSAGCDEGNNEFMRHGRMSLR